MAINIELYTQVLMENTFPTSSFLNCGTNHDQYVHYLQGNGKESGAAVVHVPQASTNFAVTKNRSVFPATAISQIGTDLTYNVDEYSIAPSYLTYSQAETVAYDVAASILYNNTETLKQTIGNQVLYKWAPATASTNSVTRILRTTGAATGNALSSGATGTRLALQLSDLAAAKQVLDADFMPDDERYMMIPSAMWNAQILSLTNITYYLNLGNVSGLQEGKITPQTISGWEGKLYGWNIVTRPQTVTYSSGLTLNTIGDNGVQTTSAPSDELACIGWHKMAVGVGKGEAVLFYNADRSEYYGSLFSALVRMGAAIIRSDAKGTVAIVQQ